MNNAPLFDDAVDGGLAHWVTTFDGLRIRVAHWTGPKAKATVLLLPGRTEYIEKYAGIARDLLGHGYATVVMDFRGQGLADRLLDDRAKGHVNHFSDYQLDIAATVAHVKKLGLPATQYMIAHSMGGAIGLRALLDGLDVKAAAFSAPMWGLATSPVLRPVAWATSHIADAIGLGAHFVPGQVPETCVLHEDFEKNTLTHDRDRWEALKVQANAHPDLVLGGPTLRWLKLALGECLRLSKRPSPFVPTITFLGTDEEIVDKSRITTRMAAWHNGTLHELQGSFHEPLMEVPAIRKTVFDTIIAHFDAHPG